MKIEKITKLEKNIEMGYALVLKYAYTKKKRWFSLIRVGIFGYGNLGRGVELSIKQNPDMTLVAVFTRRDPSTVKILTEGVGVYHVDSVLDFKDKIDVMVLCGGSATDLPVQTPFLAEHFNVVDSFDTHAKIPNHFENVDPVSKKAGKVAIISVGWALPSLP